MIVGNIPQKLIYVLRAKQKANFHFDELAEEGENFDIFPAFAANADKPNNVQTARTWSKQSSYNWDEKAKKWIEVKGKPKEITRNNDPIDGLRLVNIEVRGEGGRAWKVATEEGYFFDLREDVLLDTLKSVGCSEKGVLNGQFIWGRIGTHMRLVRVGSKLHDRLKEAHQRSEAKPLPQSAITRGSIYRMKSGKRMICLGSPTGKSPLLYFEIRDDNEPDPQKAFDEGVKRGSSWCFKVSKSPNFIECVGQVKLPLKTMTYLKQKCPHVNNTTVAKMLIEGEKSER